jgi:nucleotide-binding universal stress UspA family protein
LPHVEELAGQHESRVVLLQVVEPSLVFASSYDAYPDLDVHKMEQRTREAELYLAGWQGEFRLKRIETRSRVHYGPIVETILDVAASEGADLIAMASRGRSGLGRAVYGSVAAGLLQRSNVPILLVRAH